MNSIRRCVTVLAVAGLSAACAADPVPPGSDAAVQDSSLPADTDPVPDTAIADSVSTDLESPTDAPGAETAGPPDALGPLALSLDELCEPLAATVCHLYVGCRAATSSASVAACREHRSAACEAGLDSARARIAASALRYDADAARACLTRVGLLACAPLDAMLAELPPECRAVFTGQLSGGAVCAYAVDCAPGLNCAPQEGGACPGHCQPAPTAGEACDPRFAPCAAGQLCELGLCVAAQVALDAPCVTSVQCPAGAFCAEDEAPPRCRPRRTANTPCDDDDACAAGLYCATVDFAADGACAPQRDRDAACTALVLGEQCVAAQICDMERELCVDRPRQAGDPCVAGWQQCGVAGLYCDVATDTCRPLPQTGEACGAGGAPSCQYGWCDAVDELTAGTCRAFVAPGAPCADDPACGGLACVAGHCDVALSTACYPERRGLAPGTDFQLF